MREGFSGRPAAGPGTTRRERSPRLTCVAGAAAPARGAAAQEGVSVVVAGASVTAGRRVALALAWTEAAWEKRLKHEERY